MFLDFCLIMYICVTFWSCCKTRAAIYGLLPTLGMRSLGLPYEVSPVVVPQCLRFGPLFSIVLFSLFFTVMGYILSPNLGNCPLSGPSLHMSPQKNSFMYRSFNLSIFFPLKFLSLPHCLFYSLGLSVPNPWPGKSGITVWLVLMFPVSRLAFASRDVFYIFSWPRDRICWNSKRNCCKQAIYYCLVRCDRGETYFL